MIEHENTIRLIAFIASLSLLLLWQKLSPRRPQVALRWQQRLHNLALIMTGTMILRFILPMIAVTQAARFAEHQQWGLFNLVELPSVAVVMLSMLFLDCLIYWQHRCFHTLPWLWRLHKVHHSDKDMDTTTGIRFHPLELILSVAVKSVAVVILGAPIVAVIIFELILNILPLFNHSNVYIPPKLDRWLRYIIVTPDMHRIHHSTRKTETNSNYGFSISCWDRLFRSYTKEPQGGQLNMTIGLDNVPQQESVTIIRMLLQPFKTHFEPERKTS